MSRVSKADEKSVIFLCQYFYPEKVSSATLPTDTAKYLADNGYRVGCMCSYPSDKKSYGDVETTENYGGVEIFRVKNPTLKGRFLGRLLNYFLFTFKCLLNLKKIGSYGCVVVYSNPPVLPYVAFKAHKKYGTRVIFVSYDVYPEIAVNTGRLSENGLISRVMKGVNKKLFSVVDKVVVLSEDMKDFICKSRSFPTDKIAVIPNWAGKREFAYPKDRTPFVVTYVGNMGTCQDMFTLLGAAKLAADDHSIKFVLRGQGNKIDWVKRFVFENGLNNVDVKPFVTGEEFEAVMKGSHCFLITLEKNLKGLCYPSKYYTYLSFGRPVVAVSEQSGLTEEILSCGLGSFSPNGDCAGLLSEIKNLQSLEESFYLEKCKTVFDFYEKHSSAERCLEKYLETVS